MLAWRFVRFALHLQAFRRMAFHEELCPALFGMVRSVGRASRERWYVLKLWRENCRENCREKCHEKCMKNA